MLELAWEYLVAVKEFIETAFKYADMNLVWEGEGVEEVAFDQKGKKRIKIDPQFYRPAEVEFLKGDASKARMELGWQPKTSFAQLVEIMIKSELQ